MSEMAKTVVFVAVAAASLLLGFAVTPGGDSFDVEEIVGERLNQFEVEDPKRLKIIKFDQDTATTREFEVANENELWTIPSKQGYPADAAKQMAEAATCLIDRQILKVAATSASEHQELGVVDPSSSNLGSNSEGVGVRVTMTDSNDSELVDMIIGKSVKDAESQRFVRNADQDVVYVVEMNSDKLSTQFEDWIEKDLLQLNPMDIRRVQIKDYTAELKPAIIGGQIQMQVAWDRRAQIDLGYSNTDSKWTADSLQRFDLAKKEFVEQGLGEDEELNDEVLTELRNGLDELLLVDVEKKPAGLSADLKAGGDFLNNQEAINSLVERGFAPLQLSEENGVEILSSEGEAICTLADGVEYVLRFGNLKLDGDAAAEEAPAAEGEASESGNTGIHRYMFLMARFNESMLEEPELDEIPELPEGALEELEKAEASEKEAEAEESTENSEESDEEDSSEEDEEEANDQESTEESAEEEEKKEEEPEDEKTKELKRLIEERKSIETENQRRLSEYQEKLEASQERVKELNERFGDWYYVISDDIYKKIRLSLDQVTRKKEKKEGEETATSEIPAAPGLPGLPNLPIETEESKEEPSTEPEADEKPETEPASEPEANPESEPTEDSEADSKEETTDEPESEPQTETSEAAEPEAEPEASSEPAVE